MSNPKDLVMLYGCDCGVSWLDTWDSEIDSECPACGATCSPEGSLDTHEVRQLLESDDGVVP